MAEDFEDASWKQADGVFGRNVAPHVRQRTEWRSDDIWLRRTFTMPNREFSNLQLVVYHDEDVDVYLNGVPALHEGGHNDAYEPFEIYPAARALMKSGVKITIAVHCHQTVGGQGIDVGISDVLEPK